MAANEETAANEEKAAQEERKQQVLEALSDLHEVAPTEEMKQRFMEAVEAAERSGVKPTAVVWPVPEWEAGDREIIQIANNAAWCQACGSLMVAPIDPMVPPPLVPAFGEWKPGFRCATCYEESRGEECCYCGEDISDGPSWPELWPRKQCGSCYGGH